MERVQSSAVDANLSQAVIVAPHDAVSAAFASFFPSCVLRVAPFASTDCAFGKRVVGRRGARKPRLGSREPALCDSEAWLGGTHLIQDAPWPGCSRCLSFCAMRA